MHIKEIIKIFYMPYKYFQEMPKEHKIELLMKDLREIYHYERMPKERMLEIIMDLI